MVLCWFPPKTLVWQVMPFGPSDKVFHIHGYFLGALREVDCQGAVRTQIVKETFGRSPLLL